MSKNCLCVPSQILLSHSNQDFVPALAPLFLVMDTNVIFIHSVSSLRYSIRTVKHTYIVKSHAGVPKHPVSKEEGKNLESILSYKYK